MPSTNYKIIFFNTKPIYYPKSKKFLLTGDQSGIH